MKKRKKAFSLIEIIVVMSIIALLSSLAIPNIQSYLYKANKTKIIAANSIFNEIYIDYLFSQNITSIEELIQIEGTENLKNKLKLDNIDANGNFSLSNISGNFYIEENSIKFNINEKEK